MARIVIPKKVIIETNADGTYKTGIIQYQMQEDGVLLPKNYTMGVDSWMENALVDVLLTAAKGKIEEGEKIPITIDSGTVDKMSAMLEATQIKKPNSIKEQPQGDQNEKIN